LNQTARPSTSLGGVSEFALTAEAVAHLVQGSLRGDASVRVVRVAALVRALAALDVTTFFGQIKFDSRGINIYKPMVVEQIQSGVHHTVFPDTVADAKPQYPTPSWDQR